MEYQSMNISLTPELEGLVEERVRSGLYASASEVVREALRLLQQREQDREAKLTDLRRELAPALAEFERGEGAPLDMAAIKAEARARRKAGH